MSSILEMDFRHVWHPFTQAKTDGVPLAIVRGEGALLYDQQGKSYIDAISSWWVAALGHANPQITAAITRQASELQQVIFAGCTHPKATTLAKALIDLCDIYLGQGQLSRVFFSDNGSCAVEVALKMALQFYHNRGEQRAKFIALSGGYHGDTCGAMSVGEPSVFNEAFRPLLFDTIRIPPPITGAEQQSLALLEQALDMHQGEVAGFIYEPLIQAAGGMQIHSPAGLDALLAVCKNRGVFCIADEIMTGFYRCGSLFASEQMQHKPDIMCLSKALTGGALALGVTLASEEIFRGFWSEKRKHLFWHGHSFTANALACTAALASLEQYRSDQIKADICRIAKSQQRFCERISSHPGVSNPRTLGVVFALDVVSNESTGYTNSIRNTLYDFAISQGVLLRPLGNTLYILPPYCISDEQLERVYRCIEGALERVGELALSKEKKIAGV